MHYYMSLCGIPYMTSLFLGWTTAKFVGWEGGYYPYAYGIVCNFVQSFANSQIFISETTDKKSFTYHGHLSFFY